MYNIQEIEKKMLDFWRQKRIFGKLQKKNKGKKKFSFLDGPITANNPMGVHHAWGRTYKDLFQRFKAMQGYELRYQNGFDCQGLWVEREEEKDLGLNSKQEIEKFGIRKFVESCKKRVQKFSKIQTNQSIKLGYWMDWENSYYTNSDSNNLHNWFLLKEYHKKGWIFKGKDSVPWCPRCGTASSKHDIATEGYKEVTHKAVFMQFPLKEDSNTYFLIFTTTPWTIPANVAIAVNANIDYVKVENKGAKYWLAKSRLEELDGDYKILEKKKGKKLEGKKYAMPYADLSPQKDSPHKVVLWDLASGEEGTGIVHIAPGCGAEDFELGKQQNLPAISPLDEAGIFKEGFGEYSLKKYSDVNKQVLEDLEQRRFVYKITNIKHRYPHCWRCGEELVFRVVNEWYIKCTEDFRNKLKKENEKIKWYPEYGKVRQKDWFDNMGDWMISQKRYYGQPLPIWECRCGYFEVIGSLKELKQKAIKQDKKKVDKLVSIHRPYIDEIKIKCSECGKDVKRILDTGMAWLDAGIVSFSTIGPYLENKKYWKKWFPADLISENMPGQYRGWFNALFWASVALTGKAPFKSLFGYETLKDEKGEEMHKSKGNAIWFDDAVKKIGADPMRLLYCLQDPSQELRFGFNVVKEPTNNLNILYNIRRLVEKSSKIKSNQVEDKWIVSKLNSLIKKVTNELETLHPHLAVRALQEFWLNNLSRGYIQFIRDRLSSEDKKAKYILQQVYTELVKMFSIICPFITEKIWQELKENKLVKEESVHLSSWPKVDKKKINRKLEIDFEIILEIIEKGLASRDKAKIGLKWPLVKATVLGGDFKLNKDLEEIIKKQLNVKNLEFRESHAKQKDISVDLDTKLTPELEAEGYAREISRKIQAERKKAGLVKSDWIKLIIVAGDDLIKRLKSNEIFIKSRVNAKKISLTSDRKERFKNYAEFKIKEKKVFVTFAKV